MKQSGHPGFKDTSIPEECPQPILVGDSNTNNNTNISVDKYVESSYEVWIYFKILQKPHMYMAILKDFL
jgi:hypothetical protein